MGRTGWCLHSRTQRAVSGHSSSGDLASQPGECENGRRTEDAGLTARGSTSLAVRNTGERREKTEWHRVVIFSEGLARVAEQYLHKGSKVYIEGALQTRKWEDQSGQERYTTEVVLQGFNSTLTMLDGRQQGGGMSDEGGGDFGRTKPLGGSGSFNKELDDEIPF